MPSKLLTLVAVALVANFAVAQNWTDGFESYPTGYLCYQDPTLVPGAPCAAGNVGNSGGWDGWFNNPIEAGVIVNAPGLGSNGSDQYMDISPGLGCQDAGQPFKEKPLTGAGAASGAPYTTYPTSGGWTVASDFQIPVGGLALGNVYWIINNDYNNAGTATSWSGQCSMVPDAANPGSILVNDDLAAGATSTSLAEGVWHRIRMEVCLDANACEIYIDEAGADGILGTGDDVTQTLSSRVYAGGGPIEIANLDLYSAGGQLFYDNTSLTSRSCPVYPYQFNRPGVATMDLDGTPYDPFAGIGAAFGYVAGLASPGGSSHTVSIDGNFAPGDIAVVPAPAVASSANPLGAFFTNNALNADITIPGTSYVFGGTAPALTSPVPPLTVVASGGLLGAIAGGSTMSAQLAVLDASSSDGFALSRAVGAELRTAIGYIEPSTAAVDVEGFESWALGSGAPAGPFGTYGANWQSSATATGQWQARTGGTPSGGTGPAGGAIEGSQYIYTEISGGQNASIFEMEMIGAVSPLSAVNVFNAVHLQGANSGTYELREEDPANPGTWVVIDTLTGDQGGAWLSRTTPLMFGGTAVRLQFAYFGASSWQGDCCVDQLSIGQ